ncbi:MAG: PilZ domain-containing protein [Solirubrobacteraceae bacterium]|jgi:hypothetical protein
MSYMRIHPRSTFTEDLSATLTSVAKDAPHRVLNLSEGGMLIDGGTLDVGDVAAFKLAGPDFAYAGRARVAHQTEQGTGLCFVRWEKPGQREVRGLIAERLHREHLASAGAAATGHHPGHYLG